MLKNWNKCLDRNKTPNTLAYGEELTAPYEDSNDKVLNTITYTGHEKDYETNLTYMLARYYSQGYGVFISPDKFDLLEKINSLTLQIEDPQKKEQLENLLTNPLFWNKYTYCLDNPTNRVDKDGNISSLALVVAVVAIAVTGVWIAMEETGKFVDKMQLNTYQKRDALSEQSIENQDKNGSVGKKLEKLNKQFAEDAGKLKNKVMKIAGAVVLATNAPSATKEGEAAAKSANIAKIVKKAISKAMDYIDNKDKETTNEQKHKEGEELKRKKEEEACRENSDCGGM